MAKAEKKYYALRTKDGKEIAVFSGKQPRRAALKAATRGYTDIRLRERGTKTVHIFEGKVVKVDAPPNSPSWLPSKINKPIVKKKGIEKLNKI